MKTIFSLLFLLVTLFAFSQGQKSEDAYTRYELLEPESQSFRILYEVSAATAGAKYYFNALRVGSEHKVDQVFDLASGKPLKWSVVNGIQAAKNGLSGADEKSDYLQIELEHPVSQQAEYRLLVDKTYQDKKSYFKEKDRIVFERSLGIKRNSVVLPAGYELVKCNYPSQVMLEPDGRIKVSFVNRGPDAVPLRIEGRKLGKTIATKSSSPPNENVRGEGRDKSQARVNYQFPERAHQTREIVYFLQQPETSSFRLYHDYTETREDVDKYVNVVRAGSKASNPSALNLDTGQPLKVETLKGNAIKKKGIDIGGTISEDTEIVVIWFDPVKKGQSTRLRIEETYTDPNRYLISDRELIWDRSFGRVHNTVILPKGWFLTANSIPATIELTNDGEVSLYFLNDGPDEIDVFIKGQRR